MTPDDPYEAVFRELPLVSRTPPAWAELTSRDLPAFLADHAVCEQQAALTGLNLVAHYPAGAPIRTSTACAHG